jgi:hypothetical protein
MDISPLRGTGPQTAEFKQGGWEEINYCRTFLERKVPEDTLEPLRITAQKIGELTLQAGAVTVASPFQSLGINREELEAVVFKRGAGIQVLYERKDQIGVRKGGHTLKFRAMFPDGISLAFGTVEENPVLALEVESSRRHKKRLTQKPFSPTNLLP